MESLNNILKETYYKPENAGSLGGIDALFREARKRIPYLKRKDVTDWLKGELTYTLHKPIRRKFKRNPIISEYPLENFQADLVDMKEFSRINSGFNYILTVIDVFSKKAWAIPLKNKTGATVSNAFETIIRDNTPHKLQTDHGKEFENSTFQNLMKKYSINHFYSTNPAIKCAIVERFNRTLKNKMFRYFTLKGNRKYIGILPSLIESYNNTFHRSIGMKPNEVNINNKQKVFENLYKVKSIGELRSKTKSSKIKIGESIRKKYDLSVFDRGYYPNWTDEIFKVNKSIKGINKPQYIIEDIDGNLINRRFYPEEIQLVKNNRIYRIERIIEQKTVNGIKKYFVKWLNFPESKNSWINADDLFDING